LQCPEFLILVLICHWLPCLDAARTRWGVDWYMICAQKSLVEIFLFEFPKFGFKVVLEAIEFP
jgi:hypothetical protein